MKTVICLIGTLCCLSLNSAARGQLLVENFNYPAGENLSAHGWNIFGSGGQNPITIANSGLTYNGHSGSGIGLAAHLQLDGEDLARGFPAQTSGTIYAAFLVNFTTVTPAVSFNHPLFLTESSGTGAWGRFYIDKSRSGEVLKFGLRHFLEANIQWTGFDYLFGKTYLIVLKYTLVDGSSNDVASLFIFEEPTLPATEPSTPTLGPVVSSTSSEPGEIARIVLRKTDPALDMLVDGIRIGTTWDDSPLPVELVSFSHTVQGNDVLLKWSTATETNNYGWDVQLRSNSDWETIGFVRGNDTTLQPKHYDFTDTNIQTGEYEYRLKQIDTDGTYEYSSALVVVVTGPKTNRLANNYPNPFNPATTIDYALSEAGHVQIKIYDIMGRLITSLAGTQQVAGEYSVIWDGRNSNGTAVAAGTYFYTLELDGRSIEQKQMIMLK